MYSNIKTFDDVGEKIQVDLLGMVELYDANCISYDELINTIEKYEKLYKLKRKYGYNIQEDMIYYSGYNKEGERVYYLPIHHPND